MRVENGSRLDVAQGFIDDVIETQTGKTPSKSISTLVNDVAWQRSIHESIGRKFSGETEKAVRAEFDERLARWRLGETVAKRDAEASAVAHVLQGGSYKDWAKNNSEKAKYVAGNGTLLGVLMQKLPTQVQEIAEFASKDDKTVRDLLRNMPDENLRMMTDQAFNLYKKSVTKATWDAASKRRTKLKRKFENQGTGSDPDKVVEDKMKEVTAEIGKFDFSTSTKGKINYNNRKRAVALREAMDTWLDHYIATKKKNPEEPEITAEVVRLTARIVADPPNTGRSLNLGFRFEASDAEGAIEGFVINTGPFRDLTGKITTKLSPQQLADARVPIDRMRDRMKQRVKDTILSSPDPVIRARVNDRRLIENVAGAYVTNNTSRLKALLRAP